MPVATKSDEELQAERDIADTDARILELAEPFGDVDPEELRAARARRQELNGNANPYVPWSSSTIEFECSCGALITADMEHIHPEDIDPEAMVDAPYVSARSTAEEAGNDEYWEEYEIVHGDD